MRGEGSGVLRKQIIRAAMSVPSNIVEGSAHENPHEFARFLRYSLASASELEGHAQLGRDLNLISEADFASLQSQIENVRKMLHGLIKKLQVDE
jgi:four helix bundle protein